MTNTARTIPLGNQTSSDTETEGLAFDSPRVQPDSGLAHLLHVCDYVSIVIFTFEVLVK